ncbi:cell division regulator GpsB [Aquibacillus sediminis]|uniref:cell division regulator GpsB n=1 Tax=Aquibacillus sediminis TaxID=2574734 RepID=UPI0011089725|nr:cell division regulator GpsB [Aquibacillus sediminis]
MYLDRIQLNSKDILEKNFKTAMRGYNQEQVDEFLDIVIQDYENFYHEIERLKQENDRLKKNTDQPKTRSTTGSHQVNYDILKRLSNLEKAVFGKKVVDS